jgi:hypothetical protein
MNPALRRLLVQKVDEAEHIRTLVLGEFEVVPGARIRRTEVADHVAAKLGRVPSDRFVGVVTRAVLAIAGVRPLQPGNRRMFDGLRRKGPGGP